MKKHEGGGRGRTTNGHEWTTNNNSREEGEEGREKCVATMQWASVKEGEESRE